jgi:phosphopantetheinyl transferase
MQADLDSLLNLHIGPLADCHESWDCSYEPAMPEPGEALVVLADARTLPRWPSPLRDAVESGAWLSHEQRVRAARLEREQDRTQFIVRQTLLRHFCARLRGCPPGDIRFESSRSGKPQLSGRGPEFSISGRGPWCLLAFDPDTSIGADLELQRCQPNVRQIAGWIFGGAENELLNCAESDAERAFVYCAWTLEEAAAKREGDGIAQSLRPENRAERLEARRRSTLIQRIALPRDVEQLDEGLHLAVAVSHSREASKSLRLTRFAPSPTCN